MIARKNRRRAGDLLIALLDQFLENLRSSSQTRFNLRERMLAVCVPDEEISRTLQERQKRKEEKEEPASETAESKVSAISSGR